MLFRSSLEVVDGTITDPATGRQTTYWELFGGRQFAHQITGMIRPKSPDKYQIVGDPAKRFDLLSKTTGVPSFVQDMDLPGQLHGRVVRPPAYDAHLVSIDATAVRRMPGVVEVVQDGSFLAVIAEREEQAIWAREALAEDRKSTRLNSSHSQQSRMPSSA